MTVTVIDPPSLLTKLHRHSFRCLFNPLSFIVRIFGFFPAHNAKTLHIVNVWSFAVITMLLGFDFYSMTWKMFVSLRSLASHFSVEETVWFALLIRQYGCFVCVLVLASFGYAKKLEKFDQLLSLPNKQCGIDKRYKKLRNGFILVVVVLLACICVSVSSFYPVILIYRDSTKQWPAASKIRHVFGDLWYAHLFVIIKVSLNSFAVCFATLIYWLCCTCLQLEFRQLNEDIAKCDLREVSEFKSIALRQAQLFVTFKYLSSIMSFYVAAIFACASVISIILFYLLILNDTALSFRLLSLGFIIVCATMNVLLCFTADSLHNEATEAKDSVSLKIAEANFRGRVDDDIYRTAGIIAQQATADVGITALGFFTVSKAALLASYSFVATYVVILLQTPVNVSNGTAAINATDTN